MNDYNSTQRQIQEQKFSYRETPQHHFNRSGLGEVAKYAFLFVLTLLIIGTFLWVFGGVSGKTTDIFVLFVGALIASFFAYHKGAQTHYTTKKIKLGSHFHDVSNLLSIGDRTTRGFTAFYVPQVESVKQEPMALESEYPRDTYEQGNDRSIYHMHETEGKTWEQIKDSFDPQLEMTVSKARSAHKRHQSRVNRGETYE